MNVVLWLAAGAAIGLLASGGAATRNAIVINVLTGIVGAVLTGWLMSGLFAPPPLDHVSVPGLLVSLLGAGLLLPLVHTLRSMME